ncbi:peroxisomal membrane 22 kDa (Mpv17/PMP22) family protein [Actinidia rufa]|uniref:Peroxisomal membrane 22 kDa (Mpv17/PMP22) family protein n=1 Tax=Actinidia rufa TaxID=165716 RepID=A0A7J0DS90_9ERIC|nr:peroxisomal membrane 22 kDa (Mpv17/PMP22) family protein [Actinidia rufa]
MVSLTGHATRIFSPPTKPVTEPNKPTSPFTFFSLPRPKSNPFIISTFPTKKRPNRVICSVTDDTNFVRDKVEEPNGRFGREIEEEETLVPAVGSEDYNKFVGKAINAAIVLGFGTFAITKLLSIDHDYWHGWTLYEILRYAPEHNWIAYEEALKNNPVLAKMVISGVVYSIGDWIAQCYGGKPLFEFDRTRMFRSGLVGFLLHGSLSHYYYRLCEALFPFDDWWVVPAKVAFDQTVWSAVWNSIYFVVSGLLRLESQANISNELKATFWPMLTAGWKLWPFAHLITYGVILVEQRLLWVDCVELLWVTILSTYSNEKSEARISEPSADGPSSNSQKEIWRRMPYGECTVNAGNMVEDGFFWSSHS